MSITDKTDAWMPLWIGAYLADTQHLQRDEHGAYLLLLMAYWRAGGPLVDDDKRLAAIAKASPKEWKDLRSTMAEFFAVADGVWTHKRVEQELSGAQARKAGAASKAKAAAQARWKDHKKDAPSNAPSIPQALPEDCPTPSPPPSSSLRSEQSCSFPPKNDGGYSPEFEQAWTEYPSRAGHSKAEAFKAWSARLKDGATAQLMRDGAARYAAYCEAMHTEPRFIKHASTFFGPDRHFLTDWTPEPRTAPGSGQRTSAPHKHAAAHAAIFEGVFNE